MIDSWRLFDSRFGRQIRASDAAWARGLSPTERLGLVEELYGTARRAHEQSADWHTVERLAWRETLAERQRFVAALDRPKEAARGRSTVADAG